MNGADYFANHARAVRWPWSMYHRPLERSLERFVSDLVGRQLRVDYRWAGIFGMVFDFLPVVGRVPGFDGLWLAGGYSGHGNVLGFACGRLVARAILGESDPKLELFEPSRLLIE